jgi:adenine-specific DNA glycosylase
MISLTGVLDTLGQVYDPPPPPSDPFRHVLWDNVGYLVDDQRRRRLYDRFAAEIGLDPPAIAAADDAALMSIAVEGGMHPAVRVQRWRAIANQVSGDLDGALRALPLAKARALLKRFPTIGDPAADKILLFAGIAAMPALESNGLRVLVRLGLCQEGRSYDQSYRAGIAALKAQGPSDFDGLRRAWLVLREHGKVLCRRNTPECAPCPLSDGCPRAVASF